MKKARIILTALVVVSVVGGALAFKAQKTFNGSLICAPSSGHKVGDGTCIVKGDPGITLRNYFCTDVDAPTNTPCDLQTTIDANE